MLPHVFINQIVKEYHHMILNNLLYGNKNNIVKKNIQIGQY